MDELLFTLTPDQENLSPEELAALRAVQDLDDFLKNDPMAVLNIHVQHRNLCLLDLFKQFDKDNNFLVTADEFKQGVKVRKICVYYFMLHYNMKFYFNFIWGPEKK